MFLFVVAEFQTRVPEKFDVDDLPAAEGSISDIFRARNCENEGVILKHPTNSAWVVKGMKVLNDIFGREAKVMQDLDCENVLKCHEFIGELFMMQDHPWGTLFLALRA